MYMPCREKQDAVSKLQSTQDEVKESITIHQPSYDVILMGDFTRSMHRNPPTIQDNMLRKFVKESIPDTQPISIISLPPILVHWRTSRSMSTVPTDPTTPRTTFLSRLRWWYHPDLKSWRSGMNQQSQNGPNQDGTSTMKSCIPPQWSESCVWKTPRTPRRSLNAYNQY